MAQVIEAIGRVTVVVTAVALARSAAAHIIDQRSNRRFSRAYRRRI